MLELLGASSNLPFSVALAVMLVIAVMEGVALLLGAGLSDVFDAMLPDMEMDIDLDVGVEASGASAFTRLLGWLHVGRVPVLMLLVVFLTAFGLIGLTLQSMVRGVTGGFLPAWIATVPTLLLALPVVRVSGGVLAAIMPTDETDAVSEETFIGRVATITLGTARPGSPAEAKLSDEHGYTHYIMLEPDREGAEFPQGARVLVTERSGTTFKGIISDSEGLREKI